MVRPPALPGLASALPPALVPLALALGWLTAGSAGLCHALCAVAVLVAAAGRRTGAMLGAAGIAAGIGMEGLALLPLAIGWAIGSRAGWRRWAMLPAGSAFAVLACGLPHLATPVSGLWAIAANRPVGAPDPFALLVAAMAAGGAWTIAANAAPLPGARERRRRAMVSALGLALAAPVSPLAFVLPLAIAAADRRILATLATVTAAGLADAGRPALATFALIGAMAAAANGPRPRIANDNRPCRPIPYLP